jgi:NAD(P)-dependent dehydrogenase (short-subunit alcohol dehydrogenase family)
MDTSIKDQRMIVVGASRGLGRAVAQALADGGARVLAIGRDPDALQEIRAQSSGRIDIQVGDATDASFAARTMSAESPDGLFIVAGATPVMCPLHEYHWESFSDNWNTDVKVTFHWLQEGVNKPMRDGSRIVVFSSGAAIHGSPLSGGYAPAKQAQRYLCDYMRGELARLGRPIHVQCVMPQLNPNTGLGMEAVRAYAARAGEEAGEYVKRRFGDKALSPAVTGSEMVRLLTRENLFASPEFLLTGLGLRALERAAA